MSTRPAAVLALEPNLAPHAVEGVPVVGGLAHSPVLVTQGIRVALLETDRNLSRTLVDRLQRDFRHVVLFREHGGLPVEGLQLRHLGDLVGIDTPTTC